MDMKHNPEGGWGRACSHCSLRHAEIVGSPRKVSSREEETGLFDFFHGKRKHAVHFGLLLGTAQGDMRAVLFFPEFLLFSCGFDLQWAFPGSCCCERCWGQQSHVCIFVRACVLLLKVKFLHWRGYACLVSVNIASPALLGGGAGSLTNPRYYEFWNQCLFRGWRWCCIVVPFPDDFIKSEACISLSVKAMGFPSLWTVGADSFANFFPCWIANIS